MNPLDWSLLGGPVPVILVIAGLAGTTWVIAGRPGPAWAGPQELASARRWPLLWVPVIAGVMAGLVITLTWLIDNVWQPFPDRLPTSVLVWAWAGLAGLALALVRQAQVWTWPRRAVALLAGLLMLLGAANQINDYYQQYPSLRAALGPWLDTKPLFVPKGELTARNRL